LLALRRLQLRRDPRAPRDPRPRPARLEPGRARRALPPRTQRNHPRCRTGDESAKTPEKATEALHTQGSDVAEEKRLPNDTGTQMRLRSGQIVNVFDKGTWNVQGKTPDAVRAALEKADDGSVAGRPTSTQVFVVYGHDAQARTQLDAMLRRW